MDHREETRLVLFQLGEYAFRERCVNSIRVYVFLSFYCSGHFTLNKKSRFEIAERLDITKETLTKHLNWLLRKRFITFNRKRKSIRIVAQHRIGKRFKFNSRSAVV
jgi:hypothetical protein